MKREGRTYSYKVDQRKKQGGEKSARKNVTECS
jgi:hypothetical protein